MSELVAAYAVGAFVEPQNGESPIDADAVRLNDNTVRTGFNSHDADPAIHLQGSLLAARPAAGNTGSKWFTSDTKQIFRDNGSSWDEIDYLHKTNGGTVTGAATFSGGLTSTAGSRTFGATTFTGTVTGTSASFSSTISAVGATLTGALSGTSATFSSTLQVTGTATLAAVTATTGVFSDGFLQTGAANFRIQNTGVNPPPTGSTGVGLEVVVSAGVVNIFGFNRSTVAFAPMVLNSTTLGFYGVTPVARQVLATGTGKTVDNVITALQNLGLVSQT